MTHDPKYLVPWNCGVALDARMQDISSVDCNVHKLRGGGGGGGGQDRPYHITIVTRAPIQGNLCFGNHVTCL